MRNIRRNTFETNSSSCHSLVVSNDGKFNNKALNFCIQDDNYLHAEFGEFGWEPYTYWDSYSKLSYLLTFLAEKLPYEEETCIWCCSHPINTDLIYDKFKEREDFNELNTIIKEECHCDGIWLDDSEGYIDHQSHEDYNDIYELLHDYGIDSIRDFIFNDQYAVRTDNDNH